MCLSTVNVSMFRVCLHGLLSAMDVCAVAMLLCLKNE